MFDFELVFWIIIQIYIMYSGELDCDCIEGLGAITEKEIQNNHQNSFDTNLASYMAMQDLSQPLNSMNHMANNDLAKSQPKNPRIATSWRLCTLKCGLTIISCICLLSLLIYNIVTQIVDKVEFWDILSQYQENKNSILKNCTHLQCFEPIFNLENRTTDKLN